jgi:hypothetical protein
MPDAQCTRSPAGRKTATPVVTVATSIPEHPAFPHTMVYSLLRALPGEPGFLATVILGIASTDLDTSVGVSGPHDFAVRFRHLRLRHRQRPSHPAPRLLTISSRPSVEQDRGRYRAVSNFGKAEYFCAEGLTGKNALES